MTIFKKKISALFASILLIVGIGVQVASAAPGVYFAYSDKNLYDAASAGGDATSGFNESIYIYAEDDPSTPIVAYCFNKTKALPVDKTAGDKAVQPSYSKFGPENLAQMSHGEKAVGADFDLAIKKVMWNGFPNDAAKLGAKTPEGTFRAATQYAVWYFTDRDEMMKQYGDNFEKMGPSTREAFRILTGLSDQDGFGNKVTLAAPPADLAVDVYQYQAGTGTQSTTAGGTVYQNLLSSKAYSRTTNEPLKPKATEDSSAPTMASTLRIDGAKITSYGLTVNQISDEGKTITVEEAAKGVPVMDELVFTNVSDGDYALATGIARDHVQASRVDQAQKITVAGNRAVVHLVIPANLIEAGVTTDFTVLQVLYKLDALEGGKIKADSQPIAADDKADNPTQTVKVISSKAPAAKTAEVSFSKVAIAGGKEIKGASLLVSAKDGSRLDNASWTSGDTVHTMSLKPGEYTMTETSAPAGYAVAETITFRVTDALKVEVLVKDQWVPQDGSVVTMIDAVSFKVSKVNLGGTELKDAVLKIFKENPAENEPSLVASWTSDGVKPFEIKLAPGTYRFHEDTAPAGYSAVTDFTFKVNEDASVEVLADADNAAAVTTLNGISTLTVTDLEEKKAKVSFSKVAIAGGPEIAEASLEVTGADGVVVDNGAWVSGVRPHELTLAPGEYTMTEKQAPYGFAVAESISFRVTDALAVEVKNADGEWVVQNGSTVVMVDAVRFHVSKVNLGGEELKGAEIAIFREGEDRPVESWTSDGVKPHLVTLAPGSYRFHENAAPAGYATFTDVSFTIDENGTLTLGEGPDGAASFGDDADNAPVVKLVNREQPVVPDAPKPSEPTTPAVPDEPKPTAPAEPTVPAVPEQPKPTNPVPTAPAQPEQPQPVKPGTPTAPAPTAPVSSTPAPEPEKVLAFTGSTSGSLITSALVLLALGGVLVMRRRRS